MTHRQWCKLLEFFSILNSKIKVSKIIYNQGSKKLIFEPDSKQHRDILCTLKYPYLNSQPLETDFRAVIPLRIYDEFL